MQQPFSNSDSNADADAEMHQTNPSFKSWDNTIPRKNRIASQLPALKTTPSIEYFGFSGELVRVPKADKSGKMESVLSRRTLQVAKMFFSPHYHQLF